MLGTPLLAELHCPYCAGPLALDRLLTGSPDLIENAIVRCGCYRYPVIDGILVLRQQSGPADTNDARVASLDDGDIESARRRAMQIDDRPPTVRHRGVRSLARAAAHRGIALAARVAGRSRAQPAAPADPAGLQATLSQLRPGLYGQYLYHRYANNSFHASIPLLLLLGDLPPGPKRPRVLELTCGIGHSAFLMSALLPHLDVVASDHDFTNLWIARSHFAPNATLICLDAEVPLPFGDGAFAAVFCLDGFHYLRSKIALGREMRRVASTEALFLFPHLHNALQANIHPGIPLDPDGYRRCFDGIPTALFDENAVLEGFVEHAEFALDQPTVPAQLAQAQSLALVATRRPGYWHTRRELAALIASDPTQLMPNPLYRIAPSDGCIDLIAEWPNPALETECMAVKRYLPKSLRLEAGLIDTLGGKRATGTSRLDDLVQRFALVRLPRPAYGREWTEALGSAHAQEAAAK